MTVRSTALPADASDPERFPRRFWAAVLALTVLPTLAALGAVGLPESAIHLSDDAEWAFKAGREISLGALFAGTALSALLAWRARLRLPAIVGLALATFLLATVARDLYASDQQPSWCYADEVETAGGSVSTSGEYDGCTVLLPAKDP